MFVTVALNLCLLTAPTVCVEEIVTTSDMTPGLTFMDCMAGWPAPVAKWKGEHPIYRSERWTVERVKCVPGHYEIKGRA